MYLIKFITSVVTYLFNLIVKSVLIKILNPKNLNSFYDLIIIQYERF